MMGGLDSNFLLKWAFFNGLLPYDEFFRPQKNDVQLYRATCISQRSVPLII
jgi:hypothetical protein